MGDLSLRNRLPIPGDAQPGLSGGVAKPSTTFRREVVMSSSCGMYSTQVALGTAAQRLTCSSIRKCGHTATSNVSAKCAVFIHGVMPPMRATSGCTIEQAPCSRYSRNCIGWYIDSPTATGMVVCSRNCRCPDTSSAGNGSSIQAKPSPSNARARRTTSARLKP